MEEFFRRYFDEIITEEDENVKNNKFRNKSNWCPPDGQDPTLDLFIKTVQNELL